MAGINKVFLMGNLTKDPEFKTTPSGVSVATFSIAVGRRFATQGDEVKADFFNVVSWRNTAEFVSKYFTKGKSIVVVGSLQNRSWDDSNGQKRYVTEIIADECYFAGNQGEITPKTDAATIPSAVAPTGNFVELPTEDDLPF